MIVTTASIQCDECLVIEDHVHPGSISQCETAAEARKDAKREGWGRSLIAERARFVDLCPDCMGRIYEASNLPGLRTCMTLDAEG